MHYKYLKAYFLKIHRVSFEMKELSILKLMQDLFYFNRLDKKMRKEKYLKAYAFAISKEDYFFLKWNK